MKRNLIFIFLFTVNFAFTQVGINTDKVDEKSMLHIVATDKGVLIPRISEEQRNLIDVSQAQNGLMIFNTTDNCFDYWSKGDMTWNSICEQNEKSVFTVDCSNITVEGDYLNNVALTSKNKLIITVHVTRPGAYRINATSDNKYYFTVSGKFLSIGIYTLEMQGYGTPEKITPEGQPGDLITITSNGIPEGNSCTLYIPIQDSSIKPDYRMDCSTVSVYGVYERNKILDASHYINVTISFDASNHGAPLRIKTEKTDGISFDSGPLTLDARGGTGTVYQVVKLVGKGAPTNYDKKTMILFSNSTITSSTCQAVIDIAYPKLSIYAVGNDSYNANNYTTSPYFNSYARMIGSEKNYGLQENSTIKFEGWGDRPSDGTSGYNNTKLQARLLGDTPPDIVVLEYPLTLNADMGNTVRQYLEKGGVVLCFNETAASGLRGFLENIFGTGLSVVNSGGVGTRHSFDTIPGDPIVDGIFGSLSGKQWGEDASTTRGVNGLNTDDFIIYSTYSNGAATSFRSKKLNFIFVGDGGFNSSNNNKNIAVYWHPFWADTVTYTPMTNPSFGPSSSNSGPVDNSTFTANAIAWAIERAVMEGINPH